MALITCALVSGGAILFRRPMPAADLTLWVSADSHARMYRGTQNSPSLLNQFYHQTGKSVRLDQIATAALDVRLLSQIMFSQGNSKSVDGNWPDLVEVDIGSIGKYFRPPAAEVGFLPLNGYLQSSGWSSEIVQSRFAPWSKNGVIFGIPDDLHPCTISYRKDLFDQAGIDLQSVGTWSDFQACCMQFQQYWLARGRPRVAMGLSTVSPDMLMVMLRQQKVDLVDEDLSVHLTDTKVVRTLCWYAQAVAGPNRIGTDLNPAPGQNARDLAAGDICALITPDWMVGDVKQFGPDLAGKMHMMALPRFESDDAPTSSWGGTMIGITRSCPQPDLAWKLIQALYFDPSALKARQSVTGILPPVPRYWADPVYHQPDSFYAQQKINELYILLAKELPATHMTPYSTQAQTFLSMALNRAVAHVKSSGDGNLETVCRGFLDDAQAHVTATIRFEQAGK